MSDDRGECMNCPNELGAIDDDPNGAHNLICAKCTAEQSHDFDAEPHAEFNRSGKRIEGLYLNLLPDNLKSVLKTIPQQPQRQDGALDQLKDLVVFANRLGLYDAADAIRTLTKGIQ